MMLYCAPGETRSVFTEEKYRLLAESFVESGTDVETVLYNDTCVDECRDSLKDLDALLVWVNPIEKGQDRKVLDQLLVELENEGVYVSSAPDTIIKMGTKEVLFKTRDLDLGSNVEMYSSFDDFTNRFPDSITNGRTRVLKQFRGAGGDGVFKVKASESESGSMVLLHAKRGATEEMFSMDEFFDFFRGFFANGSPMLDQEWNNGITNGMVRCYLTGNRVAGFGYQEINALYPRIDGPVAPGKRFYFTESCALFSDLRTLMEDRWVDELVAVAELNPDKLPVIWDADFFINTMVPNTTGRYTLCEINVSCVSPFPESAIGPMVSEVRKTIADRTNRS